MAGYAGGYAISPFPVGPGVGTEATDKSVLYWDGSGNVIRGSADLLFNATLKTLTLGAGGQMLLPDGTTAAPALSFSSQSGLGIFKPGGNLLSIGLSGNERFRFDTSTVKLSIYGGAAALDFNTDTILSRASAGVLSLSTGSAMYFPDGTAAAPSIAFASDTNTGVYTRLGDHLSLVAGGNTIAVVAGGDFRLHVNAYLSWSGGTPDVSGADLKFYRDGANILAQRNTTNAQTFRIYNTYTDASNYERAMVSWSTASNLFVLGTEKAGTGSNRSLSLEPATGINYSKGHFYPKTDASWYLGLGALKWLATFTGGFTGGTLAKSANYTVDVGDHVILVNASAANRTITLPAAADNVGRIIHIKKTDSSANYVRIDGNSTELVEDATTQDLLLQGENLMLQCDGTQWWVI